MERTEIIKALECCGTENKDCSACPLKKDYSPCSKTMAENALSLIKELTEENERLSKHNAVLIEDNHILATEFKENTRADTLRELKNRLTREIGTYLSISIIKVADMFKLIDQIAEEMIGEGND